MRVLTTAPVSLSPQDPRGTRPPFARNRLHHAPVAGELLLFPPWLVHGVAPSCEMARVRVVDCLGLPPSCEMARVRVVDCLK